MLELLNQRLGKKKVAEYAQERDKILKDALDGEDGLKKVGEAASSFVWERMKHGTADPEINAIREGVLKSIREGTKHPIGGFERKLMEEEDREVELMLADVAQQVKRIRVVCAYEVREFDCYATARVVHWSCPCGATYEKAPSELPTLPDTIMIDADCRKKGLWQRDPSREEKI